MARPGSTGAMGIVISLILVTFGAILTWAVNSDGGSVDPQVVGVILIVIGIVVFMISLVLWRTWWGAGFWAPAYGAGPDAAGPAARLPAGPAAHYVRGGRAASASRATGSVGELEQEEGFLMADKLQGKRVAFLATDMVEQVELTEPWKAVEDAGAEAELISLEEGRDPGLQPLRQGRHVQVDRTVEEASADDYDALVIPGGVGNPDTLRMDENAVELVRDFFEQGKPVGVICHGPWMLVEAGVVRGRKVTSWPSLQTDIRNAGGEWVDEEVVVDNGLVTSRKPDDLPAFNEKIVEEFCEGKHAEQAASTH